MADENENNENNPEDLADWGSALEEQADADSNKVQPTELVDESTSRNSENIDALL